MAKSILSVIVPTRNRGEIIAECLTHLLALSYRPLEIIVLDQSTNDLTQRAFEQVSVEAQQSQIAIRYIRSNRVGLDAARNDGIAHASGAWFAFADDDVLVTDKWAEAIVQEFEADPKVGMVFGQMRAYYPPEAGKWTRISVKDSPRRHVYVNRLSVIFPAGAGGNMAIARGVFEHVGPFDERLGVGTALPGADDNDMAYRVLKHGYKLVYCPEAVAYHKRWLPEDKLLNVERGYYIAQAAFLIKHCLTGDAVAMLSLAVEGVGRLAEIAYYVLKGRRDYAKRAVARAKGFYQGLGAGWRTFG